VANQVRPVFLEQQDSLVPPDLRDRLDNLEDQDSLAGLARQELQALPAFQEESDHLVSFQQRSESKINYVVNDSLS